MTSNMTTPKKTIALISGSNAGIGLAVATQLANDHDYHVIIGSRDRAAGEKIALGITKEGHSASAVQLDITSDESIAAAVSYIKREYGILDVLVNNAGILIDYIPGFNDELKGQSTRELFSKTFDTNVIGTACLTDACLPLLRKSALPRLIFVSSRMASLGEAMNKSTIYYNIDYKAYDCSKAAVNMLALNYARILEDCGGLVNAACPGLVKTKLTKHLMGESPEMGARRIVELATAAKGNVNGSFSDSEGPIPW